MGGFYELKQRKKVQNTTDSSKGNTLDDYAYLAQSLAISQTKHPFSLQTTQQEIDECEKLSADFTLLMANMHKIDTDRKN